MISKNQLKLLRALGQKKQRKAHGLFLVQGEKNVLELANSSLTTKQIFATAEFLEQHCQELNSFECIKASLDDLTKASTLVSNNAAIAVVEIPNVTVPQAKGLMIALDGVSDPGNLGTIIRVADWYGIKHIIASTDCADPYNPKTISATMGSFGRVQVSLVDLLSYLEDANLPVYGAFLEGESGLIAVKKDYDITVCNTGDVPLNVTDLTDNMHTSFQGAPFDLDYALPCDGPGDTTTCGAGSCVALNAHYACQDGDGDWIPNAGGAEGAVCETKSSSYFPSPTVPFPDGEYPDGVTGTLSNTATVKAESDVVDTGLLSTVGQASDPAVCPICPYPAEPGNRTPPYTPAE